MSTVTVLETLNTLHCANCHMLFAIPARFEADRRDDHATFYCPAGHANVYRGESEKEKLRRERDLLAQRIAQRDDEVKRQRELREAAERRLSATQGVVTRIKNRVGKGVCPCCNRTFSDLARHMGTKHPGYSAEAAE